MTTVLIMRIVGLVVMVLCATGLIIFRLGKKWYAFGILMVYIYALLAFGLSPVKSAAYRFSDVLSGAYVSSMKIENDNYLIIHKNEYEDKKEYSLSVISKDFGIYHCMFDKYLRLNIVDSDKNCHINALKIDGKYYYLIDFKNYDINTIEICGKTISRKNRDYCVLITNEFNRYITINGVEYTCLALVRVINGPKDAVDHFCLY